MTTGLKVIEMRKALEKGMLEVDSYKDFLPMNLSNVLELRAQRSRDAILIGYLECHLKANNLSSDAVWPIETDRHLSDT